MIKDRLTVRHVSIWLDADLIFINGMVESSFSSFKEYVKDSHPEIYSRHVLKSKLINGQKNDSVDWGSCIEQMINEGIL